MRYTSPDPDKARGQDHGAAIFVDYENLYTFLHSRIGRSGRPDEYISEMLDELHRYLIEEVRTQTAMIIAYADFGEMHGNGQYVQRALYMKGIEPRFVPMTMQKNAAEIQLTVDAVDVLHNRPDIRSFVIVTGDRPYLPLVQQFKQYGRQAIIAMLAPPPSTENLPYVEDDVFLNAINLLSDSARRALSSGGGHRSSASSSASTSASPSAPSRQPSRPQPVEHLSIIDEGAHRALEIIEEHFGQYEEVYLTPLLRKLSELLDEEKYDPKSLISELEDAGAVWLEKRRGFPYDYTVLLIDVEHPDVETIQKALYDRKQTDDFEPPYDDEGEDFPDDDYDDYPEDGDDDFVDEDDDFVDEDDDDDDFVDEDDEDDEDDFPDDEEPLSNGTTDDDEEIVDDLAEDYEEDEETH